MNWLRFLRWLFRPRVVPDPPASDSGIVNGINREREKHGLPELTEHPSLTTIAKDQADRMFRARRLSHTSALLLAASGAGYQASYIAENVAENGDAASTVAMWMRSTGHRNNILSDTRDIGVGQTGRYWCAVFGRQ